MPLFRDRFDVSHTELNDGLLRIVLCEVTPGEEAEASEVLCTGSGSVCLTSFGDYDLVGLIPCTLAEARTDLLQSVGRFVREYEEVLCFSWKGSPKLTDILDSSDPVQVISLLKLNEVLTSNLGIEAEIAFQNWLGREYRSGPDSEVRVTSYGTLGWTEIALVWSGSEFAHLARQILRIRRLRFSELASFLKKRRLSSTLVREPVFVSSHSMPCISSRLDQVAPPTDKQVSNPEEVNARLFIMCASDGDLPAIHSIKQDFQERFDIKVSYGHYDMVVEPSSGKTDLAELLTLIKRIRGLGARYVHSTHVQLSIGLDSEIMQDSSCQRNNIVHLGERDGIENDFIWLGRSQLVKDLRQFEARANNPLLRFTPLLSQMLGRYEAARSVAELRGLVGDLEPFLDAIFNQVHHLILWTPPHPIPTVVDQEYRNIYDSLETAYRLFQMAFDQRINGAHIGLANAAHAFTGMRSAGTQRVLRAASAIPRALLHELRFEQNCPLPWNGFIVFGYERDVLHTRYAVLSLPTSLLLDPAEWWMLSHETGHEFAESMRLFERPDIAELVREASECSKHAPPMRSVSSSVEPGNGRRTYKEVEDLVGELIAEVFDFQLGFGRDWQTYVEISWGFLEDYLQGQSSLQKVVDYLVRYTFVYFYHLEVEDALERDERVEAAITRGLTLDGQMYSHKHEEIHYVGGADILERNVRHRAFARYLSVTELIRKHLIPFFMHSAPKASSLIGQVNPEVVAYWYTALEPLRSWLVELFRSGNLDVVRYNIHKKQKKVKDRLREGKLCVGEENFRPIEIVLALKREKMRRERQEAPFSSDQEWTRAVLAGLLSLWHSEKTALPYWAEFRGTVLPSDSRGTEPLGPGDTLEIRTDEDDIVKVEEIESVPARYWQLHGIRINRDDRIVVKGFYKEGELKVGRIDNLTTEQSLLLRDDVTGNPLWSSEERC